MDNLEGFSTFAVLGNHHHCLFPERFQRPQKKPHTREAAARHACTLSTYSPQKPPICFPPQSLDLLQRKQKDLPCGVSVLPSEPSA